MYYTAQADGDGISELSQSNTPASGYQIIRKLYYAERAQQDPDTGTWVQFAELDPNTTYASAKATLLAYLKERTGGTVPISLKMTWEEELEPTLLLDTYTGAAAAYSLRQLRTAYSGSAIRVRRASDNAEQDIGFSSGELDTAALASFCSGTDGFVKTWYDQASANDATQTTTANQPKIYDSSTGVLLQNLKPTINFGGTSFLAPAPQVSSPWTFASVHYRDGSSQYIYGNNLKPSMYYSGTTPRIYTNTFYDGVNKTTGQFIRVDRYNSTTGLANINYNGAVDAAFTGVGAYTPNNIGAIGSASSASLSAGWRNDMQELIIWPTYQSDSDRDGIETNINDFYSIYP